MYKLASDSRQVESSSSVPKNRHSNLLVLRKLDYIFGFGMSPYKLKVEWWIRMVLARAAVCFDPASDE